MRIVAGRWRGRPIEAPKNRDIRPTTDRARETLFNILEHDPDTRLEGARVLDLFAGTGALGFEALSRGAVSCLFVETGVEGRALIRRTIDAFGCGGVARLHKRDATRLGDAGPLPPHDIAFLDPPYGKGLGERALTSARDGGWLAKNATVVLEESAASEIVWPAGFEPSGDRVVGDTRFSLGRLTDW